MKLKKRKTRVEEAAEEMVRVANEEVVPRELITEDCLVSTGSTMLNLACSGFSPRGGFMLGSIVHVIGDSRAGKSLLAQQMMAEGATDPRLKDYDLVYEEPEARMYFPHEKMFGRAFVDRVRFIPKDEERVNPRRVQDWAKDLTEAKHPFMWVTDSFDSLTSADDLKVKKNRQGQELESGKGGWKTEKAIVAAETWQKIVGPMKASNSLYFHISQSRKKLGVTFGDDRTFSGSETLKFYRCHEIWLGIVNSIIVNVRGVKRRVGYNVFAEVKKNSLTGKERSVEFPVYDDYGVDDVGSMIDWLVKEGFWYVPKGKQIIETEEGWPDKIRSKLIEYVEKEDREGDLKEVVRQCWMELEGEIGEVVARRKPRY